MAHPRSFDLCERGLSKIIQDQAVRQDVLVRDVSPAVRQDVLVSPQGQGSCLSGLELVIVDGLVTILPTLIYGSILFWDYLPDASQAPVIEELLQLEETVRGGMMGESIRALFEEEERSSVCSKVCTEFPHERTPYDIAMWISGIALAFALSLAIAKKANPSL